MSFKFNPLSGTFDYFTNPQVERLSDTRQAGETISALKLVRALNDADIVLANKDTYVNSKVLGLALTAGNTGEPVEVLLFGKHEDASFTFTLNEPLFLLSNGTITETPPSTEFSVNIGHSLGAGAIFIDIKEQIELP